MQGLLHRALESLRRRGVLGCAGLLSFAALVIFFAAPWHAVVYAQGPTGYTQVGTVAYGTNTYTDTTVTAGDTYEYAVTSQNAAGQSGPSNIVTATIPTTTGVTHEAILAWTPPSSGGTPTQYDVYRFLVQVPGAPAGLGVTVQ